jgi:hypothetical protein
LANNSNLKSNKTKLNNHDQTADGGDKDSGDDGDSVGKADKEEMDNNDAPTNKPTVVQRLKKKLNKRQK